MVRSVLTATATIAACSLGACSGGPTRAAGDGKPTVHGGTGGTVAGGASPIVRASGEVEGEDVLAAMIAMNSADMPAPSRELRAGHVSKRTLAKDAITRGKNGFQVQFPSGAPITTPAVHRGKVLVSGGFHSKELYAFEAKSGQLAWAIDLDDDGPSAVVCDREVCVFNTESCTTFAVEVATGEMLWSWWLGDPLMSTPTIADGKVFTAYPAAGHPEATHVLAAFALKTGKLLWQKWIDADVMSAPVVAEKELYVTTFAGTMYRIDPGSGELRMARRSRATSAPTVIAGEVYYTRRTDTDDSGAREALVKADSQSWQGEYWSNEKDADYIDGNVQARSSYSVQGLSLDSSNGFSGGAPASANADAAMQNIGQANVSTLQAFQGSRVLNHQGRNISSMGDEVVATDPADGNILWSYKLSGDVASSGGFLAAPPIAAGDHLFVATLAGEVIELDPAKGSAQRRFAIGAPVRSQPVMHDGWLYVGTDDGKLVAIDTGDPSLTGWAMWGGDAAHTGAR